MRQEIMYNQNNQQMKDYNKNINIVEVEKKLIENNLDRLKFQDERASLVNKISQYRNKYNGLLE